MADKYILVGSVSETGSILHETWQTGDRLVTPDGHELLTTENTIKTYETTIEFNNERKKTFTIDFECKTPTIAYLLFYLDPAGVNDLTAYVNFDFHFTNSYRTADSLINIRSKLVRTFLKSNASNADTTIQVNDNSDFRSNDLLLINNSEKARVKSATWWTSDVTLYDGLLTSHNQNESVVKLSEFGGFTYFNFDNTSMGYFSLSFDANITEKVNIKLWYRI